MLVTDKRGQRLIELSISYTIFESQQLRQLSGFWHSVPTEPQPCLESTDVYRFDDLALVSSSQVCDKHKLQIVFFRFLSNVVETLDGF